MRTSLTSRRGSALSERIYRSLLAEIVSGQLQPKQPLVEAELTARFDVSRTPLREVLKRLAEQGLVDIYPQVGSFVAPVRLSDVHDANFIRAHLECALVSKAAENVTDDFRLQLRRSLDLQRVAIEHDRLQDFYEADEQFHLLLATIAGHPNVWFMIEQHKVHLDRVRHYALRSLGKAPEVLLQHESIARAVAQGDPKQAVQAMKEHLQGIQSSLEAWNSDESL